MGFGSKRGKHQTYLLFSHDFNITQDSYERDILPHIISGRFSTFSDAVNNSNMVTEGVMQGIPTRSEFENFFPDLVTQVNQPSNASTSSLRQSRVSPPNVDNNATFARIQQQARLQGASSHIPATQSGIPTASHQSSSGGSMRRQRQHQRYNPVASTNATLQPARPRDPVATQLLADTPLSPPLPRLNADDLVQRGLPSSSRAFSPLSSWFRKK